MPGLGVAAANQALVLKKYPELFSFFHI